jgi:hypothetical protein
LTVKNFRVHLDVHGYLEVSVNLFRVHAFAVEPRRTSGTDDYEPSGGAIPISATLRTALDEAEFILAKKKLDIDLVVDPSSRTSDVRDLLLEYAFGSTQTPIRAAKALSARLADAMDARSDECLLVLSARRNDEGIRSVFLWTFPKEDAFQFKRSSAPSIELLTDAFSRKSPLRKGASFVGRNIPPDFLRGGALDFQSTSRTKLASDLWIIKFLSARLAVSSQAATRLLVKAIANTHAALETVKERTQLFAATITLKAKPDVRYSLNTFASTFLDASVQEVFLREAALIGSIPPNQRFAVDTDVLDATLNVRAFQLESGVLVSAPILEVGESVLLNGNMLRVSGTVTSDRMKMK